ncbi:agouti-related protein-like [Acipenser oxyrinchus oxyrinchus]|uniref:Agouti-related protein-like n=1 Tax=Acipenser oxyrinchus oxyrinchus TaxID=40147 RepID=A0AAD8D7D3_ACIOX|nr:agouti-related protein-like [Acipenser oxyrinchus oxyrinchus]
MLNTLLMCWAMLQGIQVALTSVHGSGQMDNINPSISLAGRHVYPGLLRKVEDSAALLRADFDRMSSDAKEELLMEKDRVLDPEEMSDALQLQRRAPRSPRSCVMNRKSCIGHQSCCDPCDTCYCRFFNAICYCRRISNTCPHGRH